MRALRVYFWTFVRTVLDDAAAWAWLRHQTALQTHTNPCATLRTYQRIANWRQRAQMCLTTARLAR